MHWTNHRLLPSLHTAGDTLCLGRLEVSLVSPARRRLSALWPPPPRGAQDEHFPQYRQGDPGFGPPSPAAKGPATMRRQTFFPSQFAPSLATMHKLPTTSDRQAAKCNRRHIAMGCSREDRFDGRGGLAVNRAAAAAINQEAYGARPHQDSNPTGPWIAAQ